MGTTGSSLGAVLGISQADKNKKAARVSQEEQFALAQNLPWEPAYASQRTPTYQQTQSPVARKYLESILTGTNPATTFSGSPNAGAVKQYQTQQGNAMYGDDAHLTEQGAAQRLRTPYRITSRPSDGMGAGASASAFGTPDSSGGSSVTQGNGFGGVGLPQDQLDKARYFGLTNVGMSLADYKKKMGLAPDASVSADQIAQYNHLEGGDLLKNIDDAPDTRGAKKQLAYGTIFNESPEDIGAGKNTKSDGKKKWGHGRFKQVFGG